MRGLLLGDPIGLRDSYCELHREARGEAKAREDQVPRGCHVALRAKVLV